MAPFTDLQIGHLGVIVAAVAVIASAVMQFFTIERSRLNAISGFRVSATEEEIRSIRKSLSEYIVLVYSIKERARPGSPMDDDGYKIYISDVNKEAILFIAIKLHVDLNKKLHKEFLISICDLRNIVDITYDSVADKIIETSNHLFVEIRQEALTGRK